LRGLNKKFNVSEAKACGNLPQALFSQDTVVSVFSLSSSSAYTNLHPQLKQPFLLDICGLPHAGHLTVLEEREGKVAVFVASSYVWVSNACSLLK
jgi:hypothetical protein